MGYSLARKTGSDRNPYQSYLASAAWHRRRWRYFRALRRRGFEPACQVCGLRLDQTESLDLHHLNYDGVVERDGQWIAGERDEDLMVLCRLHHNDVHRILDERRRDYWGWDRRKATLVIVGHLRRSLKKRT